MQNQKVIDVKTNESKTDYPSTTTRGKGKYISDSIMLKMHLKATMKFDQTVDFFKRQKKNLKQVVDQSKHKKSLSEKSVDQTTEENQTNLSKRRVPKFFGILGKCCSCNNQKLPGEPQISELTFSQCKTFQIKYEIFWMFVFLNWPTHAFKLFRRSPFIGKW